jgi:hypothetical protein
MWWLKSPLITGTAHLGLTYVQHSKVSVLRIASDVFGSGLMTEALSRCRAVRTSDISA